MPDDNMEKTFVDEMQEEIIDTLNTEKAVKDQIAEEKEMNMIPCVVRLANGLPQKLTWNQRKLKCIMECELMRKESEAKIQKLEREAELTIDGIIERNKSKKKCYHYRNMLCCRN
ncbi:hypothetical protein JTB14_016392 [Gonioctena quinquepunctata]|nr:hypothetical protein JTB14_016392 [Gonioctena quinquepunctata]